MSVCFPGYSVVRGNGAQWFVRRSEGGARNCLYDDFAHARCPTACRRSSANPFDFPGTAVTIPLHMKFTKNANFLQSGPSYIETHLVRIFCELYVILYSNDSRQPLTASTARAARQGPPRSARSRVRRRDRREPRRGPPQRGQAAVALARAGLVAAHRTWTLRAGAN